MPAVRKGKHLPETDADPKAKIPMDREKLLGLIDACLERGSKRKLFNAKLLLDPKSIERQQKLGMRLKGVLVDLKLNKVGACVAQKSCLLYDALVYKFGQSNRHQKFWKSTLQIYSQLKRVNKTNLTKHISQLIRGLERSNFKYAPSRSAVYFMGASILERIVRLDKIRMLCFKAADSSMGFVQLKHLLTFNLMCIAIASDVASESLRQISHLSALYDSLSEWFCKIHKRFPSSCKALQLVSINQWQGHTNRHKPKSLEKVREILDLLDYKVQETTEENELDNPVHLSLPRFTG